MGDEKAILGLSFMYDAPSSLKQLSLIPEPTKQAQVEALNSKVNDQKNKVNKLDADLDTLKAFSKKEKKILLKRLKHLKKKLKL